MKLQFRPLTVAFGLSQEWPDFVRSVALGASGVYVIRDSMTAAVLYVGESHTGRLRKTFLRHFQAWTGKTAGPTFARWNCEAALIVTPPGKAVDLQNRLILKLQPSKNTVSPAGPLNPDPF